MRPRLSSCFCFSFPCHSEMRASLVPSGLDRKHWATNGRFTRGTTNPAELTENFDGQLQMRQHLWPSPPTPCCTWRAANLGNTINSLKLLLFPFSWKKEKGTNNPTISTERNTATMAGAPFSLQTAGVDRTGQDWERRREVLSALGRNYDPGHRLLHIYGTTIGRIQFPRGSVRCRLRKETT